MNDRRITLAELAPLNGHLDQLVILRDEDVDYIKNKLLNDAGTYIWERETVNPLIALTVDYYEQIIYIMRLSQFAMMRLETLPPVLNMN